MSYIDSSSYSCFISYPSYPQMQNGCICCTLRGDLLKTVKSLAQEGDFDYLVIEVCMSFALLCSISFAHISYVLIHSSSYHARHYHSQLASPNLFPSLRKVRVCTVLYAFVCSICSLGDLDTHLTFIYLIYLPLQPTCTNICSNHYSFVFLNHDNAHLPVKHIEPSSCSKRC